MKNVKSSKLKKWLTSFALVSVLALSGCADDGSTGPAGPAGATGSTGPAGSTGPTGPAVPSEITATMSAEITDASIAADGTVTATFTLADDRDYPFIGLESNRIRFTLVQLIPADEDTGESTKWLSYIHRTEAAPTDPAKGPGTVDQIQATSETATAGTLTDNLDGSYTYTFDVNVMNVTAPLAVTYNEEYTHRIAFQISGGGFPTLNRTYDWQPSTGLTTGIASREMVVEGTCNGCHGELALHGGGRVDTAYCVTCHTPGSVDANSGNTVDFKVMVHKIHRGGNLPSVQAGGEYAIWGYRDSKHDYSGTILPQDIRNCTSCHDDAIAETPDAANWMNAPTMEACGSCHEDVDFALGVAGGHDGGVMTDNSECALCHREGGLADVRVSHVGVMEQLAAARAKVTAVPEAIRIDQVTGDVEVDVRVTMDGAPVTAFQVGGVDTVQGEKLGRYRSTENGKLAINWDNGDGYQLTHQEVDFNDCVGDGAGLFTCAKPAILLGITDADRVTVTTVDFLVCANERDNGALEDCAATEDADTRVVQTAINPIYAYFNGDGTVASDSYDTFGADIEACQNCHRDPSKMHHAAQELGQCKTCHNATRASSRGRPGDVKHHVHRFHAGIDDNTLGPVEEDDFDEYPNNISNCAACHSDDQYDLPIQQNHRASVANRNAPVYISPTAVVCASCHIQDVALGYIDPTLPGLIDPANGEISAKSQAVLDHMVQNGGVFGGATFNSANKVESCAVCHAIGSDYGVDKVHSLH